MEPFISPLLSIGPRDPLWLVLAFLLGLLALPLLRRPLGWLLARTDHSELMTLYGVALALVGADLFELVGIKGDLGALVADLLVASHQANLMTLERLQRAGYMGRIAATTRHPDEAATLRERGVDLVYDLYQEAGQGFADAVEEAIFGSVRPPITPRLQKRTHTNGGKMP